MNGLRASWLLRGYGLLLWVSLLFQHRSPTVFWREYPLSFLVLGVSGALLSLFGGRVVLLLLCAVAGWFFLIQESIEPVVSGLDLQAAEYPLFPLVPSVVLVLWAMTRNSGGVAEERLESLVVRFFRLLTLSTLFWVSFHKVNTDFLGTEGSCEVVLKAMIPKRWDGSFLVWLAKQSSPVMMVLLEGTVSILLLLFAPRVGMVLVCLLFTMVSLVNAVVVTLCVIVGCAAFLPRTDVAVLRQHWRAWFGYWLLCTCFGLLLSSVLYKDRFWWYLHGVHHVVVLTTVFAAGGCQWVAWKRAWMSTGVRAGVVAKLKALLGAVRNEEPRAAGSSLLLMGWSPGDNVLRVVVAVLTLNGASPYLGWKYEYSFAMLSNLRVDDARWNHVLVPRWVRLSHYDAFVHVQEMQVKMPTPTAEGKHPKGLRAALYSPWMVVEHLQQVRKAYPEAQLNLNVSYQEHAFIFKGRADAQEVQAWIEKLPPKNRLFQNQLAIEGPQGCCH